MTMYYNRSDEEYVKAQVAYEKQEANRIKTAIDVGEPLTEIPDIDEAERIWKLLVDAAVN